MVGSDGGIPGQSDASFKVDRREGEPFHGRRILITGGSSGTGLATVRVLHGLGAEVIIGTRSEERFQKVAGEFGGERAHPFIVDLTKPADIQEGVGQLFIQDLEPTDVVLSAAGGMEEFLRPVGMDLRRLQRVQDQTEREEKLTDINRRIKDGVDNNWQAAQDVNFEGPRRLLEQLVPNLPKGARVIYYSSLWSSVYGIEGAIIPGFYRSIAGTKNMMERWMNEQARFWIQDEVYPAIVSGHLITDSDVGRALNMFVFPLVPENDREQMVISFITRADMVSAAKDILESDPKTWNEYPRRDFVYGVNGKVQVAHRLTPQDPVIQLKLPV